MAASANDIEEFLSGPLVKWLSTCVKKPEALQVYETFFDGAPINEVLLQIDPEPSQPVPTPANLQGLIITAARIKIFHCILRNIKVVYEDELGPTKEQFISKIKELSVEDQHDIVECIKKVTDEQTVVLTSDWGEQPPHRLYSYIRTLTGDRDKLLQQWVTDIGQETSTGNSGTCTGSEDCESKDKNWKKKTEILAECKEELEHANTLVAKLKAENSDLLSEARKAKVYRDEVDAMRERADRADRLDLEVQRYRERLADAEFYKVRVDELREDNRVLLETREMLETQLARARQRGDHVLDLEAELMNCKQSINEISLERDAAKEKVQELLDENLQLQQVTKSALQETSIQNTSLIDSDTEETNSGDNSLSEQLTNNAQARALRLELENKRLLSTIDSLKENKKKKLTLKCEQLQQNCDTLLQQNSELESLFKNAIQENRKLQDSLDTTKVVSDRQNTDLQNERVKISELEKNIESLTKEKQRVQVLYDTVKKRADDADKSLSQVSEQLRSLQAQADKGKEWEKLGNEMKDKVSALEKENLGLQKEVSKLREIVEIYQFNWRNSRNLNKKTQELLSQASIHAETIATLQKDLINEKVNNEKFKSSLEKLGLSLDIFDNDINLIVEKMLNNPEISKSVLSILKEQISEPEVPCPKCSEKLQGEELSQAEEIAARLVLNGVNSNENATLKVDVSTLKSQVHSLQTQQTALQLANSQLVAEKDELAKKQQIQNNQHDTLLLDQVTLRTLHEQLSMEYEEAKREQENLKKIARDLRSEMRALKETNNCLESKISNLEMEKDSLKTDARNLGNLRAEHSKLKDDFRNLFTASERMKQEYRAVQEDLKGLRTESRNLRLGQTEMQGELNSRSDLMANMQLENAKLQQKCDMLFEMNHSLDSDRRSLMDHVSQLLSQYHSLLTHSLEDKQHYHIEEKLYTDKVNNLCRQKEKLEEKIMEHYRKLDNASAKKNRRSWHEDAARMTQSQFTLLGDGSGESNGNTSDNSLEESSHKSEPFKRNVGSSGSLHGHKPRDEVALRRSHRDLSAHRNSVAGDQMYCREPGSGLSLGSVGSRRTVYLSEEEVPPVTTSTPTQNNQSGAPPILVYNRISTTINEPQRVASPQLAQPEENVKEPSNDKEKLKKCKGNGCVNRHGLHALKVCGEKLSNDQSAVDPFVTAFAEKKTINLGSTQIYNADESALYWKMLPEKTLVWSHVKTAPH
ncbi:hypothetical protein NQ317_003866 [Molorchus minor]|uniref:Girdin n=1 Tax=Molorchus minor TaxID=1323400 RepID=A0ABQ9IU26_9CUCU|nr:hypothetical protein NQ317_003866 [Molorchus minor]